MLRLAAFTGWIRKGTGKAAGLLAAAGLSLIGAPDEAAAQSTFTVQSVPNSWTATFADSLGRTITVRMQPQNTSCASIDATGRTFQYSRVSVAACDRAITFDFETSGFLVQSINFIDIDDFDGTGPRDGMAMNVPGTWTSPTIEVHSFASPPTYADQAARLTAAGAVGSFIANDSGNNPVDEAATFTMATPTRTFRMIYDDVQAGRDATSRISLNNIVIVVASGSVVASNDTGSTSATTGGTAIANVRANDTLNTVAANGVNTTLSVAPGSTVPAGLTFNTTTGAVTVAAGTPVGVHTFNYRICETGFPANCAIATATVTVTGSADISVTKTNTPGVNGNVDQANDSVNAGQTTTYTVIVTNNGTVSVNGIIVRDTVSSGIVCAGSNTVTITGNGVPAGSYTVANLTGAGITLGSLAGGQSATLSYACTVN